MNDEKSAEAKAQPTLLIRPWAIFDGTTNLLTGHDVLIEGGRISSIAPRGHFEGWSGEMLELTGATLLPGLIDCHVHLTYRGEPNLAHTLFIMSHGAIAIRALESARETLEAGVTAVRDCGGRDFVEFATRDACNSGRFAGPYIQAAGQFICMTGGHGWRVASVADGPEEVRKAVRKHVLCGSDFIKLMATGGVMTAGVDPKDAHYSLEEMEAGVREANRLGKRSASHAMGPDGILNAVRSGISSIEHGNFLDEQCIREMLDAGTYLVPTISAMRQIVAHAQGGGIAEYAVAKAKVALEAQRQGFKSYVDAGGLVAMGTDAGTPFNMHGDNCAELRHMVAFGMSPHQSILAATKNGADLMGLGDRGQIAAGFHADLVAVQGDPIADINAVADKSRHLAVIKGGTIIGQPVDSRR